MEQDTISYQKLKEELQRIEKSDTPIAFNITFSTANRKDKTGGELITLKDVLLMRNQHVKKPEYKNCQPTVKTVANDPMHHKNQTINIIHPVSDFKCKVHTRLITEFNNQEVIPYNYE